MVAISGSWGVLAPSLVALFREANRLAPNRSQSSDGSVGDLAHQQRVSDHNPAHGVVHALDLTHDPAGGWDAHARIEQLRQARDPRVKYGISLSRIFRSYGYTPWEWQPYTGENPHDKHAHLSILDTPDAENDTRPWFPTAAPPSLDLKEYPVEFIAQFPDSSGYLVDTSSGFILPLTADGAADLEKAPNPVKRVRLGDGHGPKLESMLQDIRRGA